MKQPIIILIILLFYSNIVFSLSIKSNLVSESSKTMLEEYFETRWNNSEKAIYKTSPMVSHIQGIPSILWDKKMQVTYLNDKEREFYRVKIIDNKLYYKNNILLNGQGRDAIIFVMDAFGNIYASNRRVMHNNTILHSSFFSGGECASAGEIDIDKGKIVSMENITGHYHTKFHFFIQVVDELIRRGYKFNNVAVSDFKNRHIKIIVDTDYKTKKVSVIDYHELISKQLSNDALCGSSFFNNHDILSLFEIKLFDKYYKTKALDYQSRLYDKSINAYKVREKYLNRFKVSFNKDGTITDFRNKKINCFNKRFIMDKKGNIYINIFIKKDNFFHSSFLKDSIAVGGFITIEDGKIKRLRFYTGHYKNPDILQIQLFDELDYREYDWRNMDFDYNFYYDDLFFKSSCLEDKILEIKELSKKA